MSRPANHFISGRIQRLRKRIEWIHRELARRSALHDSFEKEIEDDIHELSLRAERMSYPEIRQKLDDEHRKLKKDRRNNATKAWRDALDLSDRLLELLDEYERLLSLEEFMRGKEGSA
jgi:broad specificity phosphatase PhoE